MTFVPIIDLSAPNCPLCDVKMQRTTYGGKDFYYCRTDVVSIMTTDPFVGRWKEVSDKEEYTIICDNPKCKYKMNWFGRSLDGYQKAVCTNPKCGASVEIHGKESVVRKRPKLGLNMPCHCGSGKKYKRCCLERDEYELHNGN